MDLTVKKRARAEEDDWVPSDEENENDGVDVAALQRELANLRKENRSLKKMLKEKDDSGRPVAVDVTNIDVNATATVIRRSLATTVKAQMVYKPSLKRKPRKHRNICLILLSKLSVSVDLRNHIFLVHIAFTNVVY